MVWKEADLTATLPVRPDGRYLDAAARLRAGGRADADPARSHDRGKYKKFVSDPRVTRGGDADQQQTDLPDGRGVAQRADADVAQHDSHAGSGERGHEPVCQYQDDPLRNDNGKQEKLPVPYNKLMKGQEMDHSNACCSQADTIVVP